MNARNLMPDVGENSDVQKCRCKEMCNFVVEDENFIWAEWPIAQSGRFLGAQSGRFLGVGKFK